MTILGEHPWLILLYIVSIGLHLAATMLPKAVWLGWVCALVHGAVLTVFFLTGAALEDVLLYLLCSCTAALAFALLLPDKREGNATAASAGKEDEEGDK